LDFSGSLTFVCTGIVLSVCARTDLVGFLICLGSLIQHFSFADSGLAGSDKNRHSAAFFFSLFCYVDAFGICLYWLLWYGISFYWYFFFLSRLIRTDIWLLFFNQFLVLLVLKALRPIIAQTSTLFSNHIS
jgi:hypothetical protein